MAPKYATVPQRVMYREKSHESCLQVCLNFECVNLDSSMGSLQLYPLLWSRLNSAGDQIGLIAYFLSIPRMLMRLFNLH